MKLTGTMVKLAGAVVALLGSATLWADSVVVFNEIMYHPRTNEAALEWVELHNQMAVDVDISKWSIRNGIEYQFPEGTVVRGGGYLVVAVTPAALVAATGITNVLGPFTGRLDNGGEKLELYNNNNRLMDELSYGVEGAWPVAPDGAGPSLAKREPDTASAVAANWQASAPIGGTPGARNFPVSKTTVATTNVVALASAWKYFNGDAGADWRQTGYDDSAWASGAGMFTANATLPSETAAIPTLFSTGLDTNGAAVTPGSPDGNYVLTASAYSTPPPPAIPATVMVNNAAWLANDTSSRWIGAISQGSANVPVGSYNFRTTFDLTGFDHTTAQISFQVAVDNDLVNVALNGVQRGTTFSGFASLSSIFTFSSGFVAGTNTLEFLTANGGTAGNPGGVRVKASGTAKKRYVANTTLTPGLTTHCFRRAFVFTGAPANTRLLLRAIADDGAIFYLNGAEIHRLNLPAGPLTPTTPATVSISNATFTAWLDLPAGSLVSGTNVLAVEVHQADDGENDVLFGAEANLTVTNYPAPPPPALAFNEISSVTNTQFWVEIVNYGATSLALDNYVLARFGKTNLEYQIPARTLSPGECLVLDRATVGFGADPGDPVVLYAPGKTNVLDAVVAKSFARARFPDGSGQWLRPSELTPGTTNRFAFHDEVVINEIMYHPPDLPAVPAVYFTNKLTTLTNAWRFNQMGAVPAVDWFSPGYDDSLWPTGKSVFFANISTLPAARGTQLAISNGPSPVVTYYFRTPFVFTNNPDGATLTVNMVIDDGAVFYLNGVEIYRYGMPEGDPTNSTLALTNIGVPVLIGPIVLPATGLIAGTNILAVEVHQYAPPPVSRDVAFALEAIATGYISPPLPERPSTEQWVELYNRSSNTVDLTGWRLDNGADYGFAPGQAIGPGGYLVVAYDLDFMQANYPGLSVIGPLTKKLSGTGGLIELKDAAGNPADEVQYYDALPWPEYPDGFGASLELRDPRADNTRPEAWAASNESGKSVWQTITYRGIATVEPAASPTQWREFVLGMMGEGELLLDDLSVIEAPSGARRQLLQNGTFETGLTAWRMLGTHRLSEVIAEPGNPGNKVLRLVATGDTEHMHNHAETTLANGASITNGVEYEVSYRVKWVAGCNKLNTRLYFNRLARTTELAMPATHGTPGARNTADVPNLGPTYANLRHAPVVPLAAEPVTISVEASDPDGLAAANVRYSVNGGTWQSVPMTLVPAGSITYASGIIPAQAAASIVQFYVQGTDSLGAVSTYPDGGTNSRALYKVGDGQTLMAGLRAIRIIMTPADVALLHAPTNVMSNERFGCTVIADDERIYYGAGMHLQGSERGRNNSTRVGFTVRLPADNLLRGVQDGFTVDRSGGYSGLGGTHDEILLWHAINKAGGLPSMYDDLCQVFAPRNSEDGTGYLRLAKYGDVFLDSQYKNGGDGDLYKLELIYYPTTTVVSGDPQSLKLPSPDTVLGTDIGNLGDDPENYRWTFLKENRVARDNYAPMVGLAKAFSLTGTNLDQQTRRLMDVDEWLRAVAFLGLIGGDDIYTFGNSHNLIIYFRPEDQRGMAFLWDLDYSLVGSPTKAFLGTGSANTYKIITTIPDNYRRYYHHLYDLSSVTGDSAYMNQWANRYAGLLGQNWSGAVNYLVQRAAFVRTALPLTTAFALTSNGGSGFASTTNRITLTGTAPISVLDIDVNGLRPAITWTSHTTWTLVVPLPAYTNLLVIKALDSAGNVITNGTTSLTVTNLGQLPLLPVVVNEWMADNGGPGGFPDSADGQFQDWFELYNPNDATVNLSGYYLTDTLLLPDKWTIPTNTVIAPHGFLLVWADENGSQNGTGTNGDLHANFKLSNGGETIGLFAPDGTLQHAVTFGAQFQNVSQGLFPDGNTNQFFFMTNWTPRATNHLGLPPAPALAPPMLLPGGIVSFVLPAEPGRAYRIDYKEFLDASPWVPYQTNRADNGVILFTDDSSARRQRFYRAVLLP